MKALKLITVFALLVAVSSVCVAKQGLPFTVDNRLRFEWDDNIRQELNENDESWKIIEQLQLIGDINAENTFVSLRYEPSYVYWDQEPGEREDVHHQADFTLKQQFNPRMSLGIGDTFRYAERPELRADDESDVVIRPDNTYVYNKTDGSFTYKPLDNWRLRANGAFTVLDYDSNDVASRDDHEITTGGVDVENVFTKKTTLAGQVRYSQTDYTGDPRTETVDGEVVDVGRGDRGSDSLQLGASLQQIFSPKLIGNVRAGYSTKDFDAAYNDGEDAPYGDASVTFLPSPKTRITLGGSYMLYEPDVYPYVSQTRSSVYGSIGQDLTGKLDLFVSGTTMQGEYDAGDVVDTVRFDESALGGDDNSTQVSSRLRYNIYRENYLELGYQYTDVSSDVRRDYDRNRYWIGWQTRL